MPPIRRRIVAVGDMCGKTAVVQTFIKDEYPEPALTFLTFDHADIEVDGKIVELQVWDTCSKERFKSSRVIAYKRADVVLIFFSIYGRKSFENVQSQWLPEVKEHAPKNVPIILVGTQCKQVGDGHFVTVEEAKEMTRTIGAVDYVECRADNKFNVEELFVAATAATLELRA